MVFAGMTRALGSRAAPATGRLPATAAMSRRQARGRTLHPRIVDGQLGLVDDLKAVHCQCMGKDIIKNIGAWVTTLFVFALVCWALYYVFQDHGTAPEVDSSGKVTVDKYANSKDILLVVLPLSTAAVGYWFGNKGVSDANAQATDAKAETAAAQQETKAVVAAASAKLPQGTDILAEAKASHPDAFGLK